MQFSAQPYSYELLTTWVHEESRFIFIQEPAKPKWVSQSHYSLWNWQMKVYID